MRNTGSLEDRMLIHELYGFYSDASSRGDKQSWLSCWTEDCRWKTSMFDSVGKEAASDHWDTFWDNFAEMGFLANVGFVHVDGDVARARAVTHEWVNYKQGGTYRAMGYYQDELRRVDGVWFFSSRHYINTGNETY